MSRMYVAHHLWKELSLQNLAAYVQPLPGALCGPGVNVGWCEVYFSGLMCANTPRRALSVLAIASLHASVPDLHMMLVAAFIIVLACAPCSSCAWASFLRSQTSDRELWVCGVTPMLLQVAPLDVLCPPGSTPAFVHGGLRAGRGRVLRRHSQRSPPCLVLMRNC